MRAVPGSLAADCTATAHPFQVAVFADAGPSLSWWGGIGRDLGAASAISLGGCTQIKTQPGPSAIGRAASHSPLMLSNQPFLSVVN